MIEVNLGVIIAFILFGVLIGLIVFFLVKKKSGVQAILRAKEEAKRILEKAQEEANKIKREASIEAKEKFINLKSDFENQTRNKRRKLSDMERRLVQKEENLERKFKNLERKERNVSNKEQRLYSKEQELSEKERENQKLKRKAIVELERIGNLTQEEAKKELIRQIEDDAKLESVQIVRKIEEETKEKCQNVAKDIISQAIQRSAAEHVVETTVSVVDLPSDDMKGRIIGREGRNIRSLEMATGVDIIVDDTPEAVILSSFDPIRRETARLAIEKLIVDGRIHPARIEDMVEKVKEELDEKIKEEGESIALELRIQDLHPELKKILGKLKYRTSFGQNVLQHSKEVAYLAALMAKELEADEKVALRAGLLHDIGKAVDREVEGTHTELSVSLAKKYGEKKEVRDAIESHHRDVEFPSVEAVLVQAADTLSAARPGARRELLETYIKRLEKLEEIANSFKGVAKAFALQAGREIRIIVESQKITDDQASSVAKDIAKKIKGELDYPGQIKVTVIREMRAVEYAR
ncbi:MAG: ribonuclease Y [Candidatus Nealsonbacteria bacterium]|nr:ribonuclease Y [Candidatus Nealsonbacteria bacterium]